MAEAIVSNFTFQIVITSVETLQDVPAAVGQTVNNDDFNIGPLRLNATSSPPVSRSSQKTHEMTGSAVELDLTDLPGTQDPIDGTGLKVNVFAIHNRGDNDITVAAGVSNGYELFGSGKSVVVKAGSFLAWLFDDNLAAVDATHKIISLTGTAADECDVTIGLG